MPISETYLMDCMEHLRQTPDNYYDLCVCDPPYGIDAGKMTMGSGKHKFKKGKDWDNGIPGEAYFVELQRVCKNQIIWGGNYFTEFLPPSNDWIIWDKLNPNLSFSEAELAWCSIKKNIRIFKHYSAKVEEGGKIHPTQKSVRLYDWVFQNYAKPGDKIFDSHMGSQSSRIAAWDMGLDFYGCEIDKEYFEQGNARFETHKARPVLFPPDQMYFPAQQELFK